MTAIFQTERLVARPWCDDDAPRLFEMLSDRDITRWTSTPEPIADVGEALDRITQYTTPIEGQPHLGVWAVVPRDTQLASGTILLRPLEGSSIIEIGWSLHRSVWGCGYATEAAAGALAHAWTHRHAEVRAIMWPQNVASAAVCARLGMTDLGIVPDPWWGSPEDPMSRMFQAVRPD